MIARKKVVFVESEPNGPLRQSIGTNLPDPKKQSAALKDLHLIEAAVSTDRIVVSLDDRARAIFHDVSETLPLLGDVAWINPDTLGSDGQDWLKKGARRRNEFLLSVSKPNPRE